MPELWPGVKTTLGDRALADVAAIGAIAVTKRVVLGTEIIWAKRRVALWTVWFPAHYLVMLSQRILAGRGKQFMQQEICVGNGAICSECIDSIGWCERD